MSRPALFHTQDYRRFLELCFELHLGPNRLTYAAAAEHAGMQPTYFSNVLKGRSDFSDDQIFSLSQYLNLSELEAAYLKACHQWARSGLKERRKLLKEEVGRIKGQALRPAARLHVKPSPNLGPQEALFHLDPLHQVLWLCLGLMPDFKELEKVRLELGISPARLDALLKTLEELGHLRRGKGRFELSPPNLHLEDSSPLIFAHQSALRHLSIERMRQLSRSDFKAFSASFGASHLQKEELEEVLTQTLEKIKKILDRKDGLKADTVFQLNLDLFAWARL